MHSPGSIFRRAPSSSATSQLYAEADDQAARRRAQARLQRVERLPTADEPQQRARNVLLLATHRELAGTAYRLQDYAAAEAASARVLEYQKIVPVRTLDDRRDVADDQILRAMILARLERPAEAQQAVAPALALHRELHARGHDDLSQRVQFARALYASALAGGAPRRAALKEAAALLDGLPPAMQRLRSAADLRRSIAEEQTKSPA